jgi:hypothetical protein
MPDALAMSAMEVFAKPCRANSAIAPSSSASDVDDGSVITIQHLHYAPDVSTLFNEQKTQYVSGRRDVDDQPPHP